MDMGEGRGRKGRTPQITQNQACKIFAGKITTVFECKK